MDNLQRPFSYGMSSLNKLGVMVCFVHLKVKFLVS